jgi:hypothetical protein
MSASAFDHIEEAWGLDGNPFPYSAISAGWREPYSPEVFPGETAEFHHKVVRGAIQGNRQLAFLWSKGPGGDTGYGKTALMRATVRAINADWGREIELSTGMKEQRIVPVVAGFSELNTINRTGLYPVLFNAVLGIATGSSSPLAQARARIVEAVDDDADAIAMKLSETRNSVAPTSSALRTELVEAFCSSAEDIADVLSAVSDTTQIRSGIQYLEFAMIALAAAGVQKFFLMVDQLEDLATNKSLSRAKRQREIGRIRDLMETEPYASMLHTTFTFHATAARELDTFWEQNRLPSFEDTSANQAAVVVLKGMRDDDQVEARQFDPGRPCPVQ